VKVVNLPGYFQRHSKCYSITLFRHIETRVHFCTLLF